MTLAQNGGSYTVTPANGFYGVQALEVTAQSATAAAWDSGSSVDPVYRAFVPVFVAPPAPQIGLVTAGGQAVSGSTTDNNSTSATAFSFDVSGMVSGATVSLYMDGGSTPIASGTVASGATSIVLTTDGKTTIANGSHSFVVQQSIAAAAMDLFANFSASTGSPQTHFQIPAGTVDSPASTNVSFSIAAS